MMQAVIERRVATAIAFNAAAAGDTYECEVRIGVLVTRRGQRCAVGEQAHSFNANVSARLFFATFEQLYEWAADVTAVGESTTMMYDASAARCCVEPNGAQTWVDKQVDGARIDRRLADSWFDVRVASAVERRVEAPDDVRHARRKIALLSAAARARSPFGRAATPHTTRRRWRRSLRFGEARAWRVDFTVVRTARRRYSEHNGGGVVDLIVEEAPHDQHEIELELDAWQPNDTPAALATQCTWLIERIRSALGATYDDVRRRLRSDVERQRLGDFMARRI